MEQELINAATENFTLPHDVVVLPTGGIFYKNKKKSVKVGYLTASDENYLINALSGEKENVVMTLLKSKLYEHDLRPEELMDGDVEAILIFLRNTSFGPEYSMSLTDPKTGKRFDTTILLDELNIKKTEVTPDVDGYFTTRLPRTGVNVKLRPLTFTDTGKIAMFVESLPIMDSKYIRKFINDNQPSLDLTKCVTAPSGELVSFEITFGVEFFRPFF